MSFKNTEMGASSSLDGAWVAPLKIFPLGVRSTNQSEPIGVKEEKVSL